MYGDLVEWRKEGGCKAMLENEPTQNQKQIPIHDGNKDSLKWHLKPCHFTKFFIHHVQFHFSKKNSFRGNYYEEIR